jgi:TPR repeat protein
MPSSLGHFNLYRFFLAATLSALLTQPALAQSRLIDTSVEYHRIMAEAGIARSQFIRARISKFPQSQAEKEDWYEKAIEQGDKNSLGNLARVLYCGETGIRPIDMPRAINLLTKLTELGSASAPWLIGIAYYFGDHVPQSYEESLPWLELSGRRGNPYAIRLVTEMHEKGRGTPESEAQAIWWLKLAAGHGDRKAQQRLAERLSRTATSENDFIAVYYWLLEAKKPDAITDEAILSVIELKIDPKKLAIIKEMERKATLPKHRLAEWDHESIVTGLIPCVRHMDNPVLNQMSRDPLS